MQEGIAVAVMAVQKRNNAIDKISFCAYNNNIGIEYTLKAMNGKVAYIIISEIECHRLKAFFTKI